MTVDYSGFEYIKPRRNKFRIIAERKNKSVREQLQEMNDKALLSNPAAKTGVYVFHSKINDMIYIGSAFDSLQRRKKQHIQDLNENRHVNWMFQLLFHKYGLDNLDYYVIEFCPPEQCKNHEAKYIEDCDPEINIASVRWSSLGMDFKSLEEQDKVRDEWLQTEAGKEYKRNTNDKKRAEWAQTKVGRDCIRQDLKNLGNSLNQTNLTEEEKLAELLKWSMDYFPANKIKKITLLKFLKKDAPKPDYT
jgi:group I intron endonuclease